MEPAREPSETRWLIDDGTLAVLRCGLWRYNAIGLVSEGVACAIDPGITPGEVATLRARLVRGGARVTHVVLTHAHHDHIRGWQAFPGATVVMPRIGADKEPDRRARILAGKQQVDVRLGVDDPDFVYPVVDVRVDERYAFALGALTVEVRSLPGHSNCTSVVLVPESKTLFSADYLVHPGLPYCRFEAAPFEAAHRRMRAWVLAGEVERIVPAHEDVLVGRAAILAALDEELAYFAHLRADVRARLAAGENEERLVRAAASGLAERRRERTGEDAGARGVQDLDNARRVLEEELPPRQANPA
jgi:glyoxylase-like metal-dependent hydrolase (beta-lactamase superfamily II)